MADRIEAELSRKDREKPVRERLVEATRTLTRAHRESALADEQERGQDQGMSL